MLVAVSPYHLTSREAPAMAALLLAEHVVTLIPAPRAGTDRAALHRAVERSPHYARFMRSWEWSLPLWRAGVVTSAFDDHDPSEDLFDAFDRIDSDPGLAGLRPLMRHEYFESEERFLDELSRDILRAGPDPTFTVPLTVALDRFAARTGAVVARPEPVSVAQRAEARLADPLAAVALPVLLQAEGEQIAVAREVLRAPLNELRRALSMSGAGPVRASRGGDSPATSTALASPLRAAAARYTEAFESALGKFSTAPDEARTVAGTVAVEVARLPVDAALDASLVAVRIMGGRGRPAAPGSERDAGSGGGLTTMFVRTIGAPARARR